MLRKLWQEFKTDMLLLVGQIPLVDALGLNLPKLVQPVVPETKIPWAIVLPSETAQKDEPDATVDKDQQAVTVEDTSGDPDNKVWGGLFS